VVIGKGRKDAERSGEADCTGEGMDRDSRDGVEQKQVIIALRCDKEHDGEFDPGSERTLAARFKHASRTVGGGNPAESGARVSNT
jgi:hypothetical protein